MSITYESWGRIPRVRHSKIVPVAWQDSLPSLSDFDEPVLAYGLGRSYGDSCLNHDGVLLDMRPLNRYLAFDPESGILKCEAGVTLAEIVEHFAPKGWFLPVTPGTKFVTIGGAIANDVHGKNHHVAGTFGKHVQRFELLRSDGERLICSPEENSELFSATIGGLGLTGLILWAEIRLKPIPSQFIEMESIRFESLEEFFRLSKESDSGYEYIVSWIDCTRQGEKLGRGIFMRGNDADPQTVRLPRLPKKRQLVFPIEAPNFLLNSLSVKAFNTLYFNKQVSEKVNKVVHYNPFFYPLDAIHHWNRMYGKRGFFQYQCVVPYKDGDGAIREILDRIGRSGNASFLAVLKTFGEVESPGMLSFPRPGVTLALDLPNQGEKSLRLFEELDRIVKTSGGALYPCKDARMSREMFDISYPNWEEFEKYIDPKFSSSFWRRIKTGQREGEL
ncbi:MAG: FAD-binding oxidoreductase [Calditrichia bacterium]